MDITGKNIKSSCHSDVVRRGIYHKLYGISPPASSAIDIAMREMTKHSLLTPEYAKEDRVALVVKITIANTVRVI